MIAEELALYLESRGHGTKGSSIFLGFQPDFPDNCATIYDESAPVLEESHSLSVDEFGVQVLVRHQVYSAARDLICAIHRDLAGFGGEEFVVGGERVHAVFIATPPFSIGRDDKGRSEWTAHYRVRVESQGDIYRE
jgi:hypothetical protein